VTLRKWYVRDDVPEDLVNVFDIIYVRFFSFALMKDEVPSVVGKLYKMLSRYFDHPLRPPRYRETFMTH
jgi:hypothetical protein